MKCCDMNAGMLTEPVEFRRATESDDGAGGFTTTWEAISGAPAWANVTPLSGGETWRTQRKEANASFRFVVRYSDAINVKDVVRMRGRDHEISYIKNVEMKDEWLEVYADEGRAIS